MVLKFFVLLWKPKNENLHKRLHCILISYSPPSENVLEDTF